MHWLKRWGLYSCIGSGIIGGIVIVELFVTPFSERPQRAESRGETQIVGPSVMLRLQREGAPVFDLRRQGRPVPGAVRVVKRNAKGAVLSEAVIFQARAHSQAVVLLGDSPEVGEVAQQLRAQSSTTDIYLIPARMLEYHTLAGVSQLTPNQLQARLPRMHVLDVSEEEEFAHIRVPGSQRVSYETLREMLRAGDRSCLPPRGQMIALI